MFISQNRQRTRPSDSETDARQWVYVEIIARGAQVRELSAERYARAIYQFDHHSHKLAIYQFIATQPQPCTTRMFAPYSHSRGNRMAALGTR